MPDHKARYKAKYVDGRETGSDATEAGSSSRRREPPDVPRSESRRPDPPRRPSTATPSHSVGSSRYGNKDRPRRDSGLLSSRPLVQPEHDDRSQAVVTDHDKEKLYHDSKGYGQSRQDMTHDPADSYDRTGPSSVRRGSQSTYGPFPTGDGDFEPSSDHLSGSLAKLTMTDVVGDSQYVSSSHQDIPEHYIHDDSTALRLPPPMSPTQDFQTGSSRDKGKSAVRDPLPNSTAEGITKHLIQGTDGEREGLDSGYAKRSRDYREFFRPGRVFSTLWTESYDDSMQSERDQFQSKVTYEVSYKQKVLSKIRRFVVVRKGDRSCTCLPVTTDDYDRSYSQIAALIVLKYDGRGYKKKGINLDDHGLIYSSKAPPKIDGITKKPLRIVLSKRAEKLGNPSYLNYGRVYTVETNVKVKDVGVLDTESRRLLRAYYKEVHFRDFSDDDNQSAPGPSSDPQQSNAEVAGAGGGFASPTGQQQYDIQLDPSPGGGCPQTSGWNAYVDPTENNNSYTAAPAYLEQPRSTFPGTLSDFQYAGVPTYVMNPLQPAYQSDSRYSQNTSAARGYSSSQQIYPPNSDPRWSQPQPSYQAAPRVASDLYANYDQGYHQPQTSDGSRYTQSDPMYGQPEVVDQGVGRSSAATGQVIHEDVILPTFHEAQTSRRPRRESSTRYPTSSRGGYEDPRDYRGSSGSGRRR